MNNMNKKYYTIDKSGNFDLRDLQEEDKNFTWEKFSNGELDSYNYMYKEMFNHFIHDDIGCDYERYGCVINQGDVVLDIGANIGLFANRALSRGASKVICFEPITKTFQCLEKNVNENVICYKNSVGGKSGFDTFLIHTDFTNIGGGTTFTQDLSLTDKKIIHTEKVFKININNIFELYDNIDFMKLDIEGGEVELLTHIDDDNLKKLRCLSAEFHNTYEGFNEFQYMFCERMLSLGFTWFILYHGNDNSLLRTINFWKV